MFKENKYTKIYNSIISNAKNRESDGYVETHHIIPISLGGPDTLDNLVNLTAREHFICHWLLIKMIDDKARNKMLYALQGMKAENKYQKRYSTKITARVYEKYRIEHSLIHSATMKGRIPHNKGKPMSDEQKQKLREIALLRPKPTPETIAKRVSKLVGLKRSEDSKLKMSLALKGKPKGPMSLEEKIKRSKTLIGKPKVETHGLNVSLATKGNISIHKGNIEKRVKKDTLQNFLNEGWVLGGKKRG